VDIVKRHTLDGEASQTALALGAPRTALAYQNRAVERLEARLRSIDPDDINAITSTQINLGIAKRERAGIEIALQQFVEADSDLADAASAPGGHAEEDAQTRRILGAHLAEVRGRGLLTSN